jgi:hypothetical protein
MQTGDEGETGSPQASLQRFGAAQQEEAPAAAARKIFAVGPCAGSQGSYVFWMTYAAEAAASV